MCKQIAFLQYLPEPGTVCPHTSLYLQLRKLVSKRQTLLYGQYVQEVFV